jgi:hypothetical protein
MAEAAIKLDAAGQWKADFYVDGSMLRSLPFSVPR